MRALIGSTRPELPQGARRILTRRERQLFDRMQPYDRVHAIRVFQRVCELQPSNFKLQTAALLHDVGKGMPRLSHRVALVLTQAIGNLDRPIWHDAPTRSFRANVRSLSNHAEIGARFLEAAGTDPDIVRIVRGNGSAAPQSESQLLEKVDSQC